MTKLEIIESVSNMTNISKKDVKKIVDLTFKTMQNALSESRKVKISGFGTFEVKTRKARYRVNPLTKEKVFEAEYKASSIKESKNKLNLK